MLKGHFEKLLLKGVLWVVIILLIIGAVFIAGAVWEVHNKQQLAWQERENARATLEEVETRYNTLSKSIKNFSDERGMEEEFRKRFPVVKEGEEVIVLVDTPSVVEPEVPQVQELNLFQKVKRWIGF